MKINAVDINNNLKEYDVILTFFNDEFNKHYVVYTDNTYNLNDELNVYFNSYNSKNDEIIVKNIEDKNEYNKIKTEINKLLLIIKNENDKLNIE